MYQVPTCFEHNLTNLFFQLEHSCLVITMLRFLSCVLEIYLNEHDSLHKKVTQTKQRIVQKGLTRFHRHPRQSDFLMIDTLTVRIFKTNSFHVWWIYVSLEMILRASHSSVTRDPYCSHRQPTALVFLCTIFAHTFSLPMHIRSHYLC